MQLSQADFLNAQILLVVGCDVVSEQFDVAEESIVPLDEWGFHFEVDFCRLHKIFLNSKKAFKEFQFAVNTRSVHLIVVEVVGNQIFDQLDFDAESWILEFLIAFGDKLVNDGPLTPRRVLFRLGFEVHRVTLASCLSHRDYTAGQALDST